ncbi:hypothetical protein M422DRAFT_36797 [Sphaerobolus stellatus SS14]|uniref:Unplaced genomic scaffold SPHSTscaffold_198, whole genome shotgun sequence n=1 Tax=Sphaerobolus stellatus (strain SS14) TaxID=990650 RepID=A0A0C9UX41_SPHS4|nr:hypothetical protein M422DRAFT_36797 [Sphaerobolus stellatus SS14]
MAPQPSTLSLRGWQTAVWMLATSLQYGWHISALNQIQAALTCQSPGHDAPSNPLPSCIPMNDLQFSIVTSAFTIGGLLGSIGADRSMESLGRKSSIRLCTLLILLGSALMTVSASVPPMVVGRLLIGIGSGLGLCVVPPYLSEISPDNIKGSVGVLNQLGIVLGILFTQIVGIFVAAPTVWRFVPFISASLALLQLCLSFLAVDSPAWLTNKSRIPEARKAAARLWGDEINDDEDQEEGLLAEAGEGGSPTPPHKPPTWGQLLQPPIVRPLVIVCLGMTMQQLSGVNAVLYYSNGILSGVLPQAAAYVSLGITVVNALMTFPPIYLIERLGRRSLITMSAVGSIVSLFLVGYGLNGGHVILASVAVITFIASFAIGLGPIPFVIISDVTPFSAVNSVSSIALSLNWTANFLVGFGFLPLRNFLSGGDPSQEGRVFYLFGVILLTTYLAWAKAYNQ